MRLNTISLDKERAGLIAVAAAGGFVSGYLLSRYLYSAGIVPPDNRTVDEHRDEDTVSFVDTPRSMDSSTSLAFQQKSSRFSHPEGSAANHVIANGDSSSGSSVDTKMALVVRMDLSMVRLLRIFVVALRMKLLLLCHQCTESSQSEFHVAVCGRACQALLHSRHWAIQEAFQNKGTRAEAMGEHPLLLQVPCAPFMPRTFCAISGSCHVIATACCRRREP